MKEYKKNPSGEQKEFLNAEFDRIFYQSVASDDLAVILGNIRKNKEQLLRVLDHPAIPLHNNTSEQALRVGVIKRKISAGTRSDEGRNARDVFLSLFQTCRKNKISPWEFLGDRIEKKGLIPYLPDVIRQRAQSTGPPPPLNYYHFYRWDFFRNGLFQ